ncbi:MAG TPA: DUF2946 family protein [Burkholderiales bacterium]|nr:DUF2946 family protein [Burkholderiales bacterium]
MLRANCRKYINSLALSAMLFGALSPAFASLVYRAQPAVLAQICSLHQPGHSARDGHSFPEKSPDAHQIHCAWCSPGSAQPAIVAAPPPTVVAEFFDYIRISSIDNRPHSSESAASYQSQAPPVPA